VSGADARGAGTGAVGQVDAGAPLAEATMTRGTQTTPFTADEHASRMLRTADAAAATGVAGVLVAPGPDLVWLTGYRPAAITERLTLLVLAYDRAPILVVPTPDRPDAEAAAGARALTIVDWHDGEDPYQVIHALLRPDSAYAVSDPTQALRLPRAQDGRPGPRYQPLTDSLPMLRAVKEEHELERLAAAGAAADAAYEEILCVPFRGRRETDVAADLAGLLRRYGHEQVDFTVVGSGPNAAKPRHESGDRVIESGDTVVLEFGGLMQGYGSDTTRTVAVGQPDEQVRAVHQIVRRAQQAAFEAVRPWMPCEEIDRAARRVIADAGYGVEFVHPTGHGIGVTTDEPPYVVEGEEQPLVPGMCFSIEPSIYVPGRFGVRIEDIVTVTSSGGRRLNNTSRELRVVG
jgi:Xaa-Pro aminopeptidase